MIVLQTHLEGGPSFFTVNMKWHSTRFTFTFLCTLIIANWIVKLDLVYMTAAKTKSIFYSPMYNKNKH